MSDHQRGTEEETMLTNGGWTPPARQAGFQSPQVLGLRNVSSRKDDYRVLWPTPQSVNFDDDVMSVTSSRSTRGSGHYTTLAANNPHLTTAAGDVRNRVYVHPSELDPTCDYCVEWVADEDAPSCMQCKVPFNFLRRKSHCRACGRVVCQQCSNQKARVPGLRGTSKVCIDCFSHPPVEDPSHSTGLTEANLAEVEPEGEKENHMSQPVYMKPEGGYVMEDNKSHHYHMNNSNNHHDNNNKGKGETSMDQYQYTYGQHASAAHRNRTRPRSYGGTAFAPRETEQQRAIVEEAEDDKEAMEGMMDDIMEQLGGDEEGLGSSEEEKEEEEKLVEPQEDASSPTPTPASPSKPNSVIRRSSRGLGAHKSTVFATAVFLFTSTCVAISLLQPRFWQDVQTGVRTGIKQCRKLLKK